MSVSKILAHRYLWCFKTTKTWWRWLQTLFLLLHLVEAWCVRVKSISTHSGGGGFLSKKNNKIIPKSDASKLLFQSSNLDSNKTEKNSDILLMFLLLHQPVTKYQITNFFVMIFFVVAIQKRKIENRQLIFSNFFCRFLNPNIFFQFEF